MSMQAEVTIDGIGDLAKKYQQAPQIAGPILADAINTTLSQISAYAIDGGGDDMFDFITPRSLRTGLLSLSFNQGIQLANAAQLWGSIGPTVYYAIFVHEGTGRSAANPFMERIVKKIEPVTDKIFSDAGDRIAQALTL